MSKPRCNGELTAEAVRLKKQGMSNRDIIAQLCIGESTFYKWMNTPKNDAEVEFGKALKAAEAEFKTALRQRIIRAADGGAWQAAAWMLERQYPEEYAKPEVQLAQKAAKEAAEETLAGIQDVLVKIADAADAK